MGVAFIFPGQGSQFIGMGKVLSEQFPDAHAVFEEVNDSLEQKLSKIMFEGPEEELILTANAQPALMAVSIAVLKVMERHGLFLKEKIDYVAGHSLGEYSALCATGMFSLRDTARLLRIRGNAMQEAVPIGKGAMAAIIGLSDNVISTICREVIGVGVCQIANDNGAGQFVISGTRKAVEHATAVSSERGARHVTMLPVSAPFHSDLMKSASETMRVALASVPKKNPLLPIVTNISVEPVQDFIKIVELLVKQITGRVRWRETVEWFASNDIMDLYEIGPGRILTGLARRINGKLRGMSVGTAQEIEIALKALDV